MKKFKKGFTIVELVIVIAVIAILAGVLIPTFSGIVKKARISSDTQVARNLNTSLAADEAINGKPENFNEVLSILKNDGYIISNLNPTTEGWYYVWESETNQILLVNEDYNVKYSSNPNYRAIGETWYFAVSDANDLSKIQSAAPLAKVFYTPKTATALKSAISNALSGTGTQTVIISEDMTLKTDNAFVLNNASTELLLDLADKTIASGSQMNKTPFTVNNGKMTLQSGIISASGKNIDAVGNCIFAVVSASSAGWDTTTINGASIPTDNPVLNLIDVTIDDVSAENLIVIDGGTATIDGCTLKAKDSAAIQLATASSLTIKNTTISQSGKNSKEWNSAAIMVGNSGGASPSTLLIESGNFNAEEYLIVMLGSGLVGAKVEIKGGDFTTTTAQKMFLFEKNNKVGSIEITGGTFNGTSFAELDTIEEWQELITCVDGVSVKIVIDSNKVVITYDN